MAEPRHGDYWNHNTAYHPWIMGIARRLKGDVLDVGCGDGLLAQRLAPVSRSVTAIDADAAAVQRARQRVADRTDVTVAHQDFQSFDAGASRFDLITFVASLHHLELRAAFAKARTLLAPTGEIAVVGLSANRTPGDWLWSVGCVAPAWIGSRLHRETPDIGVVLADPREGLGEIRRVAEDLLPGARLRRGLYFRYLLRWSKAELQVEQR